MTSALKEVIRNEAYNIMNRYLDRWGRYLMANRIKKLAETTFGKDEFFKSRNEDTVSFNYDNNHIIISIGRLLNDIIKQLPGGQI